MAMFVVYDGFHGILIIYVIIKWKYCLDMTLPVDWDVKQQIKTAVKFKKGMSVQTNCKVQYVCNKLKQYSLIYIIVQN